MVVEAVLYQDFMHVILVQIYCMLSAQLLVVVLRQAVVELLRQVKLLVVDFRVFFFQMLVDLYKAMLLQSQEVVEVEGGGKVAQVDIPLEEMVINMVGLIMEWEVHKQLEVQEVAKLVLTVNTH
jgi:hypothetical protein